MVSGEGDEEKEDCGEGTGSRTAPGWPDVGGLSKSLGMRDNVFNCPEQKTAST